MNDERIILVDESKVPESERFGELIIRKFPFRIGRRRILGESPPSFGLSENDLYLDEPGKPFQASRNHLEIGVSGGSVYVRDLRSANGTIVNGLRMGGKRRERSTLLLERKDNLIQLGKGNSQWMFHLKIPLEEKRFRMVIADDDDFMRETLQDVFDEEYDIIVTEDGETALDKCLSEDPDIAVLDWEMPKLKGIEVCKYLKCNLPTSNLPIVMLTGRIQTIDRITGIEVGADDYITKPPDLEELKTRVNGALARCLHARDVHWLTGIASEHAFRNEVDKLLKNTAGRKEFAFLRITMQNLGEMAENHGSRATEKMLRLIAETLWNETVRVERTVIGHLSIGQWCVLTPWKKRHEVENAIKSQLQAMKKDAPVRYTVKSHSSKRCTNYYDFVSMLH